MEAAKVEAFSDGVFAVAMTLLIYQVEIPPINKQRTNAQLLAELRELWPYYISLFVSFFTILIMWMNHHRIFKMINKIDNHFMFANGFLLFLVTIVPYPTLMVSKYLLTPSANTAAAVYAGIFCIINIAYTWLWYAASHDRNLLIPSVRDSKIKAMGRNFMIGFPAYLVAFITAFFNAYVSLGICILTWIYWALILKANKK